MPRGVGLTIENILKAAVEIADAKGLNEVTLATLADKLSVASPSLYNHIDGLQQLREKLSIYCMEQLHTELLYATAGKAKDDAVHALGEAYITFVHKHPGLYDAIFFPSDENNLEVQNAAEKIVELVIRILSAYGLEEDAAIHVARGLRSIFHGFSSIEQKGGFGLPINTDLSYRMLINTYLAGVYSFYKLDR